MGVALPGVFSGIDTETIITQLMQINRRSLYALEDRKALWEARQSAVGDIEDRLSSLKSLLAGMRSVEALRATTASCSDKTILTATASSAAGEGSHQVVVDRLATAHRLVHTDGLASLATTVGVAKSTALNANGAVDPDAAWFTTTANGATYTFDFGDEADIDNVVFAADTGYSMNQVAALINARSQALSGYDAAAVEYDSQKGQYFLRLTAQSADTAANLTQSLTAGDAVDELHDEADWSKTAAGTGKLAYTYSGTARTVYVNAATTLGDLCDLINNDGANPGVTASVLEYNGAYHLVLAGQDTGQDYTISVDSFETTLSGFDADGFTETQAPQDARVRVDGYPSEPDWIQRSSNTISDVIPGVTLKLQSTGEQPVTVTLSRSTAALTNAMNTFVDRYNELMDAVETYTGYDDESEASGLLQGDSVLASIVGRIHAALVTSAPGFDGDADTYALPVQIGLKTDRYGKLSLVQTSTGADTSLDDALSADYLAVLSLIGAAGSGASDDNYIQFTGAEESTAAGFYDVEVDFNADGTVQAGRIKSPDESEWRSLEVDGNMLMGAAGNPEGGLQITAISDGTPGGHTQSAQVRVRQGFAGAIHDILDDLLDPTDGAIALKKSSLGSAVDQAQDKIEIQETRLEAQERRLRDQYARLEAFLARFDAQRGAFEAMFMQLEAMSRYR